MCQVIWHEIPKLSLKSQSIKTYPDHDFPRHPDASINAHVKLHNFIFFRRVSGFKSQSIKTYPGHDFPRDREVSINPGVPSYMTQDS